MWVDGKECYSQDVLFTLVMSRLSEGKSLGYSVVNMT